MKTATREITYIKHSRHNKPTLQVQCGEKFMVQTELASGPWLQSMDDEYTLEKDTGPNPCAVIDIEGVKAGDVIAVTIHGIEPGELGYTGFHDSRNFMASRIFRKDWGLTAKTLKIKDGFIQWSDKIKIPVKPMVGTLGTAPLNECKLNNPGGIYGGNMDCQEVCMGATVYLPVFVDGALLHVGDVHAIQGDGEINMGGGTECRAEVILSVEVIREHPKMKCVRAENDDYIMTIACIPDLREAFCLAASELLNWIVQKYEFTIDEGYLFMGQLLEARCTQIVGSETITYVCKMPKKYLEANLD